MSNLENNFHKALEKDIDVLKEEIKNIQESEERTHPIERKEVVKKSFKQISEQQNVGSHGAPSTDESKRTTQQTKREKFLPNYMQSDDVDPKDKMKVEELMDTVIHKGLLKALRDSKKQPPFIQDAFHDALAEKLLPVLKRKGILK